MNSKFVYRVIRVPGGKFEWVIGGNINGRDSTLSNVDFLRWMRRFNRKDSPSSIFRYW